MSKAPKYEINPEALPALIRRVWEQYEADPEPFSKVRRLVDLLEVWIKFHTVLAVSHYFSREQVAPEIRGILGAGLQTPSLGIWWQFAREVSKALREAGGDEPVPGFLNYMDRVLKKAVDGKADLIHFRNQLAHGARPEDAVCLEQIEKYGPQIRALITHARHLEGIRLISSLDTGERLDVTGVDAFALEPDATMPAGQTYLKRADGSAFSLFPLLCYGAEAGRCFFYNDLKSNAVTLLNYDACKHWRSKELRRLFLEHYPIHEWKKAAPESFVERVEQLTETFKGRRELLASLLSYLETRPRGVHMLWGGPGIGKSALMARLVQILNWPPEIREADGWTSSGSLGRVAIFEYFIRRGQRSADAAYLLDNLNQRLEQHYHTRIPLGGSPAEKARLLEERLRTIADQLAEDERLMLFIDGLDEGVEADQLLASLPKQVPEKVLLFYAAREHPRVRREVYDNLDREQRYETVLRGLEVDDVRAILAEHVDKYATEQAYLERLAELSEGNPLYLKLICDGLSYGDFLLNDLGRIPRGMQEIYKQILTRVCATEGAGDYLRLLAVAQDYLEPSTAAAMLGGSIDVLRSRVLPVCMELLMAEDESTGGGESYQLFHESLREHIRTVYPEECARLNAQLDQWCIRWSEYEGEARAYALRYLPAHANQLLLSRFERQSRQALERLDELIALLQSEAYREQSFETLGHGKALQAHCAVILAYLPKMKEETRKRRVFAETVLCYHSEPARRYAAQMEKVDRAGGDTEALLRYAECGDTPREKVLIALRGLSQRPPTAKIQPKFLSQLDAWCEAANEPALKRLVAAYVS